MRCPNCKFENPEGFKFCGNCGDPLSKQSLKIKHKVKDYPQHRQLTVLFCDLVDSTTLSEQLDLEDYHNVLEKYQNNCANIIRYFEGHIAQYLGDGVLAYFGYPLAHEDDAQRAVQAGLKIVDTVNELPLGISQLKIRNEDVIYELPLKVRIGIHTGQVLMGQVGGKEMTEQLALGEVPNIAATIQKITDPNEVVISSETYNLVEGFFECAELNSNRLSGLSTPIQLYRVLKPKDMLSRFDVRITKGLTPIVGREEELGILDEHWNQVKKGQGQIVLLIGEAGIGKSRLVHEFKESIGLETRTSLECQCSPFYRNTFLHPVIRLLEQHLEFKTDEASEEKFRELEAFLMQYDFSVKEAVQLFASLLSLPIPDRYPPLNMIPQSQKQMTLESLVELLIKMAEIEPVLLIMEDLHWVDSSTVELLSILVDTNPKLGLLTILTSRPDFSSPWSESTNLTEIKLAPLNEMQAENIIKYITEGKALPTELLNQLVSKSDGIPLYVEELTKTALGSNIIKEGENQYELIDSLSTAAIPITLNDSLMARLDRMTTAKEVAQLGAVIGREFSYDLIKDFSHIEDSLLKKELSRLVESGLLFEQDNQANPEYVFKHALIQDTAYKSLSKRKRKKQHKEIARIFEEKYVDTADTQPEILAFHYAEGGVPEKAVTYYHKAGQRALERSANLEAMANYYQGLKEIEKLPEGVSVKRRTLTFKRCTSF